VAESYISYIICKSCSSKLAAAKLYKEEALMVGSMRTIDDHLHLAKRFPKVGVGVIES